MLHPVVSLPWNFEVESSLIRKGGGEPVSEEEFLKGRIQNHEAWFRGWAKTMAEIDEEVSHRIPIMNSPMEIATIFDKYYCQRYLAESGIPVPRILGKATNADAVFRLMESEGVSRVFVKPRHSSSASGVVALQRNNERVLATSSALLAEGRLYNSLKISRYENHQDVTKILDLLGREKLLVEQWFPKAVIDKRVTDFRVLVIDGKARHVVARTSRSPITNLHLGNARGDIDALRQRLGKKWDEVVGFAERVASVEPDMHYLGMDVMIGSDFEKLALAEANAFGDLLPNVLTPDGSDTYHEEARRFLKMRK